MHPSLSFTRRTAAACTGARLVALAAALGCALAAPVARAQARVENPFAGATWYLSPEYAQNVAASAAKVSDPTLKAKVARVASYPTAFWLDRIAAIQGSSSRMGLAAHLDAALAQQQAGKPVVVTVVIYNLPGRDCSALSSNGELGPTDLARYKSEYIDPIAAIEGNPKYAPLRIVNVIEIDSLPNIVTNVGGKPGATAMCDTMKANGNYVAGVQYALGKLHAAGSNTYNYVDAGHHGWLGWDDNFTPSAQMFADTARGAPGGFETVQGFITNTSNYSALVEPYLTVTEQTRASKWVDWNRYVDEKSFATALRSKLVSLGFSSSIGMLIDTSRNGWGGSARPTRASTASDVNTMVNESRIDRRYHAGNWCNQSGAGLGERPQVVGADGIHAYVWVKPPGESDGNSQEVPNSEGKGFDRMCDPTYGGNARNGNNPTGAKPSAPLSGAWFHDQLVELVQNAYPAVPAEGGDPSPTGDFELTAGPRSLSLNQGESGSTTVLVGKIGAFAGTVALTATDLPSGVTATFLPASTSGQSTLSLTAASGAATGMKTVTISGTSGGLTRTASLYLTVNGAGAPSFTLSASPASLTIARGASRATTLTVSPSGGFTGAVTLSVEGLPPGVTATPATQSPTSSTTVTFSASASAQLGSATVTLAGTAGSVSKGTPIALTVTDGGSGSSSSGGTSSGGTSSGGTSSGGTSSGGTSSGGTSSGGTSSGGRSSSGGTGSSGGAHASSGGCSSAGGPDVALALLVLAGASALRLRRRPA